MDTKTELMTDTSYNDRHFDPLDMNNYKVEKLPKMQTVSYTHLTLPTTLNV